jgi:hypothetical protein
LDTITRAVRHDICPCVATQTLKPEAPGIGIDPSIGVASPAISTGMAASLVVAELMGERTWIKATDDRKAVC